MNLFSPVPDKNSSDRPLSFFLCYFSPSRGQRILTSDPPELREDSSEKKTLSVHSIWFFQGTSEDDTGNERIDLEIGSNLYAASQFSLRITEKKVRTFILIIKSSPRSREKSGLLLPRLQNRFINEFVPGLADLVERDVCLHSPFRKPKYKEKIRLGDLAEEQVMRIWSEEYEVVFGKDREEKEEGLVISIDETSYPDTSLLGTLLPSSEILVKEENSAISLKKRIQDIGSLYNEKSGRLSVILRNSTDKDATEVAVTVSMISDFFQETLWSETFPFWPSHRSITVSFDCSLEHEYLITLKSRRKNILVRKISPRDFISSNDPE